MGEYRFNSVEESWQYIGLAYQASFTMKNVVLALATLIVSVQNAEAYQECQPFDPDSCAEGEECIQVFDESCQSKNCDISRWVCVAIVGEAACLLDSDTGPCEALFQRWYYNAQTEQCEQFIWGGCEGNDNNFESKEDCEGVCRSVDITCSSAQCEFPQTCINVFPESCASPPCPISFKCVEIPGCPNTDFCAAVLCAFPPDQQCFRDSNCRKGEICCQGCCNFQCQPNTAPSCSDIEPCPKGQICQLQDVNCFTEPCYPLPVCVDDGYQECEPYVIDSCGKGEECVQVFDKSCRSKKCDISRWVCVNIEGEDLTCANALCKYPKTCINVFPKSCKSPPCPVSFECVEIPDCQTQPIDFCATVRCAFPPDHQCFPDSGCGKKETCCKGCCRFECEANPGPPGKPGPKPGPPGPKPKPKP